MSYTAVLTSRLQVNASALCQNNTQTKTQTIESTLSAAHHTSQIIGTGYEDVSTGDVTLTKQHMVRLENKSTTAVVTVEAYDGTNEIEVGKLLPGEPWGPVRLPAQTAGYPKLRIKSDTASTIVEVVVGDAGDPAL